MQKNQKKKGVQTNILQGTTNCTTGAKKNHSTQLTDSQLQILPLPRWGGTAFGFGSRPPPFLLGPAGAALQLAQIEAQLALHQINAIATATAVARNQTHLTPSPLTLLNLLHQTATTSTVTAATGTPYRNPHHHNQHPLQTVMYRPQPPGAPFSRGGPERGHGGRSQVMGYQVGQFPPPTQLPDELESALAIRGPRDEDSRLGHLSHLNPPMRNNQGPGKGQRLDFSSSPVPLTSDNQPGHQRGMDWTQYQPPRKLFCPPQQQQGQSHSNPPGGTVQAWSSSSALDSPSQLRGGDFQALHTPESAGTILASFGLSNEDLELLSHYPDDQLTPDTLPFILRDIQRNKASGRGGRNAQSKALQFHSKMPPPLSRGRSSPHRYSSRGGSPDLPSMLTVTQTAGKVIDYGHASRALEEGFKREPLSKDVLGLCGPKISGSSPSHSSKRKSESPSRRHHSRNSTPSSSDAKKYSNEDYRRRGQPKIDGFQPEWTPVRDQSLPASAPVKSRPEDFNHHLHPHSEGAKLRPLSESRSESSTAASSKGSGRLSMVSKRQCGGRSGAPTRLPTPTMISDFRAEPPKVYPHTCSLCHKQCEQAKDWLNHINTVNHTASCRDLRNQYPEWSSDVPRTNSSPAKDGSHRWRPKGRSPSRSISRSLSWSPSPSPPSGRGRRFPPPLSERHHHRRSYSPLSYHAHSRRGFSSSSCHRPEKRTSESSGISTGSSSQGRLKRSRGNPAKRMPGNDRSPSSVASASTTKAGPGAQPKVAGKSTSSSGKTPVKPGTKAIFKKIKPWKMAIASPKDMVVHPPPAKKKKKKHAATAAAGVLPSRLVYLSGLPADASKQEVGKVVESFGKIRSITLHPCPAQGEAQEASAKAVVCMARAEDARSLGQCFSLSIRDRTVSASASKKSDQEQTIPVIIKGQVVSFPKTTVVSAKSTSPSDKKPETKAVQKIPDKMGVVLILGLPESGYSESDIIKLAQPFGTPSEIVMATELGKALVILPDEETAEEMVKVHTFVPVKVNEAELKMSCMRNSVDLSTPVALYNILTGPADAIKAPVIWNTLLVVRNVPDTLTGPAEVQKVVKRFGAFKEALVLNHNMIIFEMTTSAVALAVCKRFQKYPCIIQNNPLTFSRRADPRKNNASASVVPVPALLQSPAPDAALPGGQEVSLLNGEGKEVVKEEREGTAVSKPAGGMEESPETQRDLPGCEVMEMVNTEKIEEVISDLDPASKPRSNEPSTAMETVKAEHTPLVTQPAATADPGQKDQPASQVPLNNPKLTSEQPKVTLELPKVTPEILKALLEECRARSSSRAIRPPAPPLSQEGNNIPEETGDGKDKEEGPEKKGAHEEGLKKERERSQLEEEDKTRRLEEKREREEKRRREEERRRSHRDGSSGSRSSGRSEVSRRSTKSSTKRDTLTTVAHRDQKENEETRDEEDAFMAFNMEDFVTVDEVGDAIEEEMEVGADHTQTTVPDMPTPGVETTPADTAVAGSNTTAPPQSAPAPEATATPSLVTTTVSAATPSETTPALETTPQSATEAPPPPVPVLDTTSLTANGPDTTTTPVVEATPTPVVEATPTPVVEATPTPVVEATPTPAVQATPTPVVEATPTPAVQATHTPAVQATPTLVVEATATPALEATPITVPDATPTPVMKAMPTYVPETTPTNIPETMPMPVVKATPTPVLEPMSIHLGKEERGGKAVFKPAEVNEESPETQRDLPGCEVMKKVKTEKIEGVVSDLDPASKPGSNEPSTTMKTVKAEHTPPVNQPAATADPGQKDQPASQVPLHNPKLTSEQPKGPPELPNVTPEILKALLEECRARSMPRTPSTLAVMAKQKLPLSDHRPTVEEEQRLAGEPEETPKKEPEEKEEEQDKMSAGRDCKSGNSQEEREEEEDCTEPKQKTKPLFPKDYTLPPFNPSCPVGLEFLEPKIGFFCKVCSRFYTGTEEAEKTHCRSIKHYQNLQKSLQQWRCKENRAGPS
ncbi:uncharacterized protein LOC134033424 [Osmerus eperlanus]|uniref:uncharacterized protein LOC134033424 n=1 Tax=Osmerus eperlanus TaxID=29151 RepID=UPI002E11A10C